MMKHTLTMVAWAMMSGAPAVVAAQAATAATTSPGAAAATTAAPGTCDCPVGDPRGELKNLAAFAPLGLLGAMAAAGGLPGIFAARTDDQTVPQNVASNAGNTATDAGARSATDAENAATERARNAASDPANPTADRGLAGAAPSMNRGRVPDGVSPDSLRAGLRAPNTGTPLPSVFLLGTGLIAIGCVTVLRTRS